jgi:hypothetical protein
MPYQLDLFDSKDSPTHGVRLLLERMKTNPEEFHLDSHRWGWVCAPLIKFGFKEEEHNKVFAFIGLTTTEIQMMYTAFVEASRDNFTSKVLESLTNS